MRVGIIGATGMVGRRFVSLLEHHPWFEIAALAAGPRSEGMSYGAALASRGEDCPAYAADMQLLNAWDAAAISGMVDMVFCAVNIPRADAQRLEESYARCECPVVSNNSACRSLPDVPVVIPEVNAWHLDVIPQQRRRLGTKHGFIAAKCNCSIQSSLPPLAAARGLGLKRAYVATYQAVSGAGRTLSSFPDIHDNVIPFIPGEDEKSETEPKKILGMVSDEGIVPETDVEFFSRCVRVPVSDGHTAAVFAEFEHEVDADRLKALWSDYGRLDLPSAPERFIRIFDEPDRPQPALDRYTGNGMSVCIGGIRQIHPHGVSFIGLSHNTVRGAAGGAVLLAEMLANKGFFD